MRTAFLLVACSIVGICVGFYISARIGAQERELLEMLHQLDKMQEIAFNQNLSDEKRYCKEKRLVGFYISDIRKRSELLKSNYHWASLNKFSIETADEIIEELAVPIMEGNKHDCST